MSNKILASSTISEVNTTAAAIIRELGKGDFSSDAHLMNEIAMLAENNNLLTKAIKEKKLQSVLGPLDELRDDSLRVIFREIHAKVIWRDPQIKAAGLRIDKELAKYGHKTINLAYADESASINALLEDFKKPDVVEAIQKLPGMNVLINWLATDQKEFEKAFDELVDLQLANKKTLSATRLSKLILVHINEEILVYLRGVAKSKPEIYKAHLEKIEEFIEINNKKVKERLAKPDEDQDPSEA